MLECGRRQHEDGRVVGDDRTEHLRDARLFILAHRAEVAQNWNDGRSGLPAEHLEERNGSRGSHPPR